jgi:hypothetical protein
MGKRVLIALACLGLLVWSVPVALADKPADRCPNLPGWQRSVPDGYVLYWTGLRWECIPTR